MIPPPPPPDFNNFPTAKAIKLLTSESRIHAILLLIRQSSRDGMYQCTIPFSLDKDEEESLRNLGYSVHKNKSGDCKHWITWE